MFTETAELLSHGRVSFGDVMERAESIQSLCSDYDIPNVQGSNFIFEEDGSISFFENGTPYNAELSDYAIRQLLVKLGIPTKYIEKCFKEGLGNLAADNVNSWLDLYERSFMLRGYNGGIRGILSDRYVPFDTPDIMKVLGDTLNLDEYSVKGYYISPERFHARFVQNTHIDVDGEDLFAGLQIDSSDVGRSTLMVRFMIYKQICTNGLCIAKDSGVLFAQRHLGITAEDFRTELSGSLCTIPTLIDKSISAIKLAQSDKIALHDGDSFVKRVVTDTNVSDEQAGNIIQLMQDHYSETRWGYINAITEIAQRFSLERRIELEKFAGGLLKVA